MLDDDQALAAICLSEKDAHKAAREGRQAPSMRLAAALLGSYERQIQSVEGALRVCVSQTPCVGRSTACVAFTNYLR